jgi:hypothetical protein
MLRMGIFDANGKRFCTKGRRPFFRMPIRNVQIQVQDVVIKQSSFQDVVIKQSSNIKVIKQSSTQWTQL